MNATATTEVAATRLPRIVVTNRGTWAMAMFIATETTLFVCLFFAYYYLGQLAPRWPPEPPDWRLALVMLIVLLTSSGVLHWSESCATRGLVFHARVGTALTAGMGLTFLLLQVLEFRHHLEKLRPSSNAYGSIFYTITSVHAAHVGFGILMLAYVLALPEITEASKPPHRPLHNASLYWHFVDVVWFVIVILLYVVPNVGH